MSKWPPARVATEAAEEFYYFPRTRLAIDSDLPSFLEMVGRSGLCCFMATIWCIQGTKMIHVHDRPAIDKNGRAEEDDGE